LDGAPADLTRIEKLIRDRIPELAVAQSRVLSTRIATDDELDHLLGLKLVEETHGS
jgi:predicted house-cleaning noncanonical NTP pyrophosphatase (MazG superfamily)